MRIPIEVLGLAREALEHAEGLALERLEEMRGVDAREATLECATPREVVGTEIVGGGLHAARAPFLAEPLEQDVAPETRRWRKRRARLAARERLDEEVEILRVA